MIKSITVTNYLGTDLKFELGNPAPSGFLVFEVNGLGPGKADINTTKLISGDGSVYNYSSINERNITLLLHFMPKPSIEHTRHTTYSLFPLKKPLTITVETDEHTLSIDGYVESNEPVIFSKDEYTQISIICPSPYFEDHSPTSVSIGGITPMLKFPLSLPSTKAYALAHLDKSRIKILTNSGSISTGCLFTLTARGMVSKPKIQNTVTDEWIQINTDLIPGESILINTKPGQKSVFWDRGSEYENIINRIEWGSTFIQLYPGENRIVIGAESGADNLVCECVYSSLYEGI